MDKKMKMKVKGLVFWVNCEIFTNLTCTDMQFVLLIFTCNIIYYPVNLKY